MKVYRVEDDCDSGMYPPDGPYQMGVIPTDVTKRHPHPSEDGIYIFALGDDYVFGFTSKVAARRWFGLYTDKLQRSNFRVSVYSVDPAYVRRGKRQCAFLWKEAELIEVFDPVSFLLERNA